MEIVCPAWHPSADKLVNAIPLLANEGVTAIEIGIDYPDYFDRTSAIEVEHLMLRLHRSGIRVHSIHSPFGPRYDISSSDDETQERGVDALINAIELANLIGAEKVIVHASDVINNNGNGYVARARGVLREVSVIAKEAGIRLALENLPPAYLGHTPEQIFEILEGLDRETIGVCFDSGHANLSGQFHEFAKALLPHAITTHIHDNDGNKDKHWFPGSGIIDWRDFGDVYRKSGTNATIMLECLPPESIAWSKAFQMLRQALGE